MAKTRFGGTGVNRGLWEEGMTVNGIGNPPISHPRATVGSRVSPAKRIRRDIYKG